MPKENIHPKMQPVDFYMNGNYLFTTSSTLVTKSGRLESDYDLTKHPAYNENTAIFNESNTQVAKFRQQARAINYTLLKSQNAQKSEQKTDTVAEQSPIADSQS